MADGLEIRRTLMDILSEGEYKTYKDLPEIKQEAITAMEFLTWAEHVPEGEEANLLNLALAIPFFGKASKGSRSIWNLLSKGKKSEKVKEAFGTVSFPSAVLRTGGKGEKERLVTAVTMFDRAGNKVIQPFYKSTGSSGAQKNIREGSWMPFLGILEKGNARLPQGWFIKGRQSLEHGGMRLHQEVPSFAKGAKGEVQDYWLRMGSRRMHDISEALSRAEKKGMLKPLREFREGIEGRPGMRQYATGIKELLATSPTNPYARPWSFITEKSRLASLKRMKEDPDFNWYREHWGGRLEFEEGVDLLSSSGSEINKILKEFFKVENIPQQIWNIPY